MGTIASCAKRESDEIQPFPQMGRLIDALNLGLPTLKKRVPLQSANAYCYIVKTIEYRADRFIQTGSGPNFQGGIITLCTCKHQMRSRRAVESWPGQWIAGFTSRAGVFGQHYLVYLMRVSEACASHQELWYAVPAKVRQAKAAHLHPLGDLYQPKSPSGDPHDPLDYVPPCADHNHAQNDDWHNDIDYKKRRGRQPPLLVGDSRLSFLWDTPALRLPWELPRDYTERNLPHLLDQLEAANGG